MALAAFICISSEQKLLIDVGAKKYNIRSMGVRLAAANDVITHLKRTDLICFTFLSAKLSSGAQCSAALSCSAIVKNLIESYRNSVVLATIIN